MVYMPSDVPENHDITGLEKHLGRVNFKPEDFENGDEVLNKAYRGFLSGFTSEQRANAKISGSISYLGTLRTADYGNRIRMTAFSDLGTRRINRKGRIMLKVRLAEAKDISRILELLVQVDMVHHNGRPDIFNGPATKYNREELEVIIADETTPVFVCVNDDDYVMGHAFCVHKQIIGDSVLTDIRTLYIDDICVAEDSRGNGVGRMLYDYVIDFAKKNNYYNVTLNVWSCNPGAMKFYEAMGMVPQKIGMEKIL